ncbi:hypothetical protein [Actinoplanes sp. NPDC048796]|uniref:hypothetical protein n=1 Tax=unclassified Actinoplanes TaxID=2626549 RepID=UPI0033EC2FBD
MQPPGKPERAVSPLDARPDRSVLVACIAGTGAVVASVMAFGASLITDDAPAPPPPGYCAEVILKYRELVKGSKETVDFLGKKGKDGKSAIEHDDSAVRCGLSADGLAILSGTAE